MVAQLLVDLLAFDCYTDDPKVQVPKDLGFWVIAIIVKFLGQVHGDRGTGTLRNNPKP